MKRIKSKSKVIMAAAAAMTIGSLGLSPTAHATGSGDMNIARADNTFTAVIRPLNNTNAAGTAVFTRHGRNLSVSVNASGLEPGVHPQHIHGKDQMRADCPTSANDTNGDGYLSVIEGAPAYGAIKTNLTSPQTPFGAPPTPALFYPFAGTPQSSDFPVAAADGTLRFEQTYRFDNSSAAQAALASVASLGDQAYVIHGATAPLGVDAPAFAALGAPRPAGYDPSQQAYDPLLPAGCGTLDVSATNGAGRTPQNTPVNSGVPPVETATPVAPVPQQTNETPGTAAAETFNAVNTDQLVSTVAAAQVQVSQSLAVSVQQVSTNMLTQSGAQAFTSQSEAALSAFSADVAGMASQYKATAGAAGGNPDEARNQLINAFAASKDRTMSDLTVARNQLIDRLNQAGTVGERDAFLAAFDAALSQYGAALEQAKNQL